jgi:hypothetical protein
MPHAVAPSVASVTGGNYRPGKAPANERGPDRAPDVGAPRHSRYVTAWPVSSGRPEAGRVSLAADGLTTLTPVSEVTADALDAEDQKIITLARSTRARVAASEGAAVRDETGRTYTAAAVALPSLRLSALRLAVAMAVSSGAESLEAAALVSDSDPDPGDLAAVRDLGPTAPVFHAAPDGTLRATLTP